MTAKKLFEEFKKENPKFPVYILDQALDYLPKDVKDADVKRVLDNLKQEYIDSLVTPNEAIGVITAQSVGERSTQMTLNTFHFAGVASQSVEGLPRLIEILDAKKNLKAPQMKIYMRPELKVDEAKIKIIAAKIQETKLSQFVNDFDIDLENKILLINLDVKRLKALDIDVDSLIPLIDKKYRKNAEIVDSKQLKIKATASATLKDLMTIKESCLSQIVYGIKGVRDVAINKVDGEYIIITSGVALRQVMNLDEVDNSRIYCNDFHEIHKIFGVEAARETIVQEFMDVVNSQGLSINERHILLVADTMTQSGEIKAMNRYGIVIDKQNVLTRASFETALKHIALGALENESNELKTITENVMTNQMVRVGTGIPKISVKNSANQ